MILRKSGVFQQQSDPEAPGGGELFTSSGRKGSARHTRVALGPTTTTNKGRGMRVLAGRRAGKRGRNSRQRMRSPTQLPVPQSRAHVSGSSSLGRSGFGAAGVTRSAMAPRQLMRLPATRRHRQT